VEVGQNHLLIGQPAIIYHQLIPPITEGGKHVGHQFLLTGADLLKSDHVRAVQIVLD